MERIHPIGAFKWRRLWLLTSLRCARCRCTCSGMGRGLGLARRRTSHRPRNTITIRTWYSCRAWRRRMLKALTTQINNPQLSTHKTWNSASLTPTHLPFSMSASSIPSSPQSPSSLQILPSPTNLLTFYDLPSLISIIHISPISKQHYAKLYSRVTNAIAGRNIWIRCSLMKIISTTLMYF